MYQLEAELAHRAQIGSNFATSSPAKKPKNLVLKNAVGGLMLLLEKLTGKRATIRNLTDDTAPTLSSPEARINRECRNKPLSDYEHQILLGGTITSF